MRRRDFLRTSALGAAGCCVSSTYAGPTALQSRLPLVGIQLYTVRDLMADDVRKTLEAVANVGFDEVEFAGYFDKKPKDIAKILKDVGMRAPSAHITTEVGSGTFEEGIEAAAIIGHEYLVWAWIEEKDRRSLDDYRRFAEQFNRIGEACRKSGIQFCYHNHDFEFVAFHDGEERPFDLLLRETDPSLVQIELDLYWISKARQDPFKYFADYSGRFPLLHVKDMDDTDQRGFAELGRGTLDFRTMFRGIPDAGARHFFFEQDETSLDVMDAVHIGYQYLREVQF